VDDISGAVGNVSVVSTWESGTVRKAANDSKCAETNLDCVGVTGCPARCGQWIVRDTRPRYGRGGLSGSDGFRLNADALDALLLYDALERSIFACLNGTTTMSLQS
jgi:hypothetical protein